MTKRFTRRDFLYKRSHWNGAHLGLAARASTPSSDDGDDDTPSTSSSTSSSAKATSPITSLSPASTTSSASPTSAHSTQSPSSTPATSSPSPTSSPSSPSSPTPTSATSKSSSSTPTASSIVSTPLTLASTPTTHASSVSTRIATGTSFTLTPSLSPSATSSAGSSGGANTSAIVGGIAGALAGIAFLGCLLMWCMRRQRGRDNDDFDAKTFKRQSAVLVDDPSEPARSYNPRPPTMIERHNASPALATQGDYGGQNFYGDYGGHGQQSPYAPEMIQSARSPPPQAYGAPPMGYAGYNDPQQQISRQPSNVGYAGYDSQQRLPSQPPNAAYLTRQPTSAAGYAPLGSFDPNAQYVNLNRSSVSPYQAAQYADISRQLGTPDPNGQVLHAASELPDGPLPSPFDDAAQATPVPDVSSPLAAPGPVSVPPTPQTQGNAHGAHQRPATLYDEGDAYGGI